MIKEIVVVIVIMVASAFSTMFLHDQTLGLKIPTVEGITIDQPLYDTLSERYVESADEFVYCLYGSVKETDAHIDSMYLADIKATSEEHVVYGMCSPNSDGSQLYYWTQLYYYLVGDDRTGEDVHIGTIHNHPNANRFMSLQDSYTFGRNSDIALGIISGVDEMTIYTPDNFIDGIILTVK